MKKKDYIICLLISLVTIALSIGGSYFVCKGKSTTVVADYHNLKIDDTGIALSVKKVYDSVVVVENYVNDKLYGTGSGVLFKEDDKYGYILTNSHVIEDGTNYKVIFTNNKEYEATVVGSDEFADIAVLKVSKEAVISVAIIGKSTELNVGDTLFSIGAPLDETYSWTVTRGILSGKDRVVETDKNVMTVLQTDAAINEGNSGGALCNANGEVIGITNMKISSSKVEGMGFAIPIETALEYASNFINGTPIIRPYLGISMYNMNMFFKEGVYVKDVEKDSPAFKAGIQAGDVIVALNDEEVTSTAYLKYLLYKYQVGEEVNIKYNRKDKEYTTKVVLGSFDILG